MSSRKSDRTFVGENQVVLLNPTTCGIYKKGDVRYKTDPATGRRTDVIDNDMAEHVEAFLRGTMPPGGVLLDRALVEQKRVLVPRYFDHRWDEPFVQLCKRMKWKAISIGDLEDAGVIKVRGGHGSPSNDARSGHIPYVKVSDIRSLRVNTNPTNLVSEVVAQRYWRGPKSGLNAWDLITPNRASSNIGEFAFILPGGEDVVLTKEVFVIRVLKGQDKGWDPFYLLWALCLKAVRNQWQRVALMQTNREDVSRRYREIMVPVPPSKGEALELSKAFRDYFTTLAAARTQFVDALNSTPLEYIASATALVPEPEDDVEE